MFWLSRGQRESAIAVNHHWNQLVEGSHPAVTARPDSGLIEILNAISAANFAPTPDGEFVHRLEALLIGQFDSNQANSPAALASLTIPRSHRTLEPRLPAPPVAENRVWPVSGGRRFAIAAACLLLLIVLVAGAFAIYQRDDQVPDNQVVIPAIENPDSLVTPTAESVVLPLAVADFDPGAIASPEVIEGWTAWTFMVVELRPGLAHMTSECPGCYSLIFALVLEGELTIEIDGPVITVSDQWTQIEPETTVGHQVLVLQPGDTVVFDAMDLTAHDAFANRSDATNKVLMGFAPYYGFQQVFASSPTLFTQNSSPELPTMAGGSHLFKFEEIAIGPGSVFAFEVDTSRLELYLLTSGQLTAVDADGNEPDTSLTTSWKGPTGVQVDGYPEGPYTLRNDSSTTAFLYRMVVDYPVSS